MAITSRTEEVFGIGEVLIRDWSKAGLLKPSSTKSAISTIDQGLVLKKLGSLSISDFKALDKALKDFLSI